jgi:hypothetical protein
MHMFGAGQTAVNLIPLNGGSDECWRPARRGRGADHYARWGMRSVASWNKVTIEATPSLV